MWYVVLWVGAGTTVFLARRRDLRQSGVNNAGLLAYFLVTVVAWPLVGLYHLIKG